MDESKDGCCRRHLHKQQHHQRQYQQQQQQQRQQHCVTYTLSLSTPRPALPRPAALERCHHGRWLALLRDGRAAGAGRRRGPAAARHTA